MSKSMYWIKSYLHTCSWPLPQSGEMLCHCLPVQEEDKGDLHEWGQGGEEGQAVRPLGRL